MPWTINAMEGFYIRFINAALENEATWKVFKTPTAYTAIIGQPSPSQAYGFIKKMSEDTKKVLPQLMKADEIGSPPKFKFGAEYLSLNLCRYIDSVCLLEKEFGTLDGMNITEVGAGWGGLAHAIQTRWRVGSYHIIDLPEAMMLAAKHSKALGIHIFMGSSIYDVDLAIAEYSVTEQTGDDLERLTRDYLMTAKNVFVRSNFQNDVVRNNWVKKLETKFNVTVYPEDPVGVRCNFIVVGKAK